jgi:hypothetical protein
VHTFVKVFGSHVYGLAVSEARTLSLCPRSIGAGFRGGEHGCDAFLEDSLASPARPGLQPSLLELSADGLSGLPVDPYADLPPPEPREFSIGDTRFIATNVCRRCVVPTRDSRTGAVSEHFRDAFEARRSRGMRVDVDAGAWGTPYRMGVNLALRDGGGALFRGSALAIQSPRRCPFDGLPSGFQKATRREPLRV